MPYCVEGFCERNADQLDSHLKKLLQARAEANPPDTPLRARV